MHVVNWEIWTTDVLYNPKYFFSFGPFITGESNLTTYLNCILACIYLLCMLEHVRSRVCYVC